MSGKLLFVCVALIPALASAGEPAPTTRPSSSSPATILVLPFAPPPSGGYDWIGRAVQQDLLADLSRDSRARVIAPADLAPAADAQAALNSARQANATHVVFGQAQAAGSDMRITGQVLDVSSGQSIGTLKATGPVKNLFPLEDALADQVTHSLPQELVATPQHPGAGSYYSITVPQYRSYSYSAYEPYPYPDYYVYRAYPYYYYEPYAWPWFETDVFLFGGRFHHHHFHDWDDFHHGWGGREFLGRPGAPRGFASPHSFGHAPSAGHAAGAGRR